MSANADPGGWNILPPVTLPPPERLDHVRGCSEFAAHLLDRYPDWIEGLDSPGLPEVPVLTEALKAHGLEAGLRRFRNREMLRIVWRDLCGMATLGATFASLTRLAELCLQAAIDEHERRLYEKHGTPRGADGRPQRIFVIGLGKFGGGELNLSSDIDIIFCYPESGSSDGRRSLANDQFFTRLARAVIASLSELTEDGFCFRVDTRLRPFGTAGPLTSSLAALEQYYQREGRDWERYALVKARPVAGDRKAGARLLATLEPFIYRRYVDFGAVEALHEIDLAVETGRTTVLIGPSGCGKSTLLRLVLGLVEPTDGHDPVAVEGQKRELDGLRAHGQEDLAGADHLGRHVEGEEEDDDQGRGPAQEMAGILQALG